MCGPLPFPSTTQQIGASGKIRTIKRSCFLWAQEYNMSEFATWVQSLQEKSKPAECIGEKFWALGKVDITNFET